MPSDQHSSDQRILEILDVRKYYPVKSGLMRRHTGDVRAVDGVSFAIGHRETVGLVGESGCGKTTLGRVISGAFPPTDGRISFHPSEGDTIDVGSLQQHGLRDYLRHVQMIFQDPHSSLNPRRTVKQIIEEPLICLSKMAARERDSRVRELLEVVGLDSRHAERYPHAFSGGQRQRIGIARALAIGPSLIVADESVSALDVSVQGQIINLLMDLQRDFDLALLFIAHDLAVVRHISSQIAVMYVGKLVELAPAEELFHKPLHPYTEALLSSVPRLDPDSRVEPIILGGSVADPANRPSGCCFHPRCPYARAECTADEPPLRSLSVGGYTRQVACHFAEQFSLAGINDRPDVTVQANANLSARGVSGKIDAKGSERDSVVD